MTPYDIEIGTRLELELMTKYASKSNKVYISQIMEHISNNSIIISAPIFERRLIYIPDETPIRLTFIHPRHGVLSFVALVKGKDTKGNVAVLVIEPAGEIEKIQRRLHFRLDIALNALVWLNNKKQEDSQPVYAVTKNISGSGLCIVTETDIPVNSEVKIELDLSDDTSVTASGKILRNQVIRDEKGKKYELGLMFTEISKSGQDTLIKFIFKQQQLLLKKKKWETLQ